MFGLITMKLDSDFKFTFLLIILTIFYSVFSFRNASYYGMFFSLLMTLFLFVSFFNSKLKKLISNLRKYWIFFGSFIGHFVNPVILALIFFLLITPYSLILKLFGRDELKIKKSNYEMTYWKSYTTKNFSKKWFKNQF